MRLDAELGLIHDGKEKPFQTRKAFPAVETPLIHSERSVSHPDLIITRAISVGQDPQRLICGCWLNQA